MSMVKAMRSWSPVVDLPNVLLYAHSDDITSVVVGATFVCRASGKVFTKSATGGALNTTDFPGHTIYSTLTGTTLWDNTDALWGAFNGQTAFSMYVFFKTDNVGTINFSRCFDPASPSTGTHSFGNNGGTTLRYLRNSTSTTLLSGAPVSALYTTGVYKGWGLTYTGGSPNAVVSLYTNGVFQTSAVIAAPAAVAAVSRFNAFEVNSKHYGVSIAGTSCWSAADMANLHAFAAASFLP